MSKALLEHEARQALTERGITCVPGCFCRTDKEVIDAAKRIGYPVVLKIVSPDVVHKSDCGGVAVNLVDESSLADAYQKMMTNIRTKLPDAHIEGVLVTKHIQKAHEVIVGAIRDAQFGPVVMVGLGGVFVEVMKDVSFGIAPVSKEEAMRMLSKLKSFRILTGIRGEKSVNLDALCSVISRVSHYAYENPVEELDLNPVFCTENAALVADARILLGE